ncbi:MAG TPA: glycosyltransferase family 39 protein, partial [Vicinamibacterales bacterium]|nr:glycosyltransferase family 39 protein [Vicinamibacterales bacterium]
MRTPRLALALVLAAAAALRFSGLGHGLPHAVDAEESEIVGRALQMMKAGSLDPRFFDHGQLPIYLQLAVSIVRFLAGSMAGEWQSLAQAGTQAFFVWGRALVAAFGVATVVLVFNAGMRWGARHALLAAALMAVMPVHVLYSHLVVPDVLLTLLVTATLLLALAAGEKRTLAAFALAGAAAGLAASARYTGGLALVMPLLACLMSPPAGMARLAASGVVVAAAGAGFLAGAPYSLLDLPAFLERFAQLCGAARDAAAASGASALMPLRALQAQFAWPGASGPLMATAWPALVLVGVGIGMAAVRAVRGPGQVRYAVALAFVVMHLALVLMRRTPDPRFLLPMMPMLALLTASAVISGVSLLRRYEFPRLARTAIVTALTILILVPGAVSATRQVLRLTKQTTMDLAYSWLLENVRPEELVIVEASVLKVPRGIATRGIGELRFKTADEFVAEGARYLIATSTAYGKYISDPRGHRDEYLAYTRLFSEAQEVARFS